MKSLLFTGGNGFLASNTIPILKEKFNVTTLGMVNCDYNIDIVKDKINLPKQFDVVVHAAGKAHSYPKTAEEIKSFYDVNFIGTKNLCAALEKKGLPDALVYISTMAVYGSDGSSRVTENHPLNGETPYAKSKLFAEQYLLEWGKKFNVKIGILRPALLVGPNPPGNLGSMIKGIKTGRYLSINHGKAKKSFLMVYDIANVIPKLIEKGGVYNICASEDVSYGELEEKISTQLNKKKPVSIPFWMAKCMAKVGDFMGKKSPINTYKLNKLTKSSLYDNSKIKKDLNWEPLNILENFRIE